MFRRRNTPRLTSLAACVVVSAVCATPAAFAGSTSQSPASVADYQLVNTQGSGAAPITEVLAAALPAGSIFEPAGKSSPLTIMAGSSGFNASDVQVVVGDGTNSTTGQPVQVLQLNFDSAGFKAGGVLNFSLELTTATPPQLELVAPVSGLTFSQIPSASGTSGSSSGDGSSVGQITNAIPEPVSVLLWTAAAAGILLRARSYRRRDPFQG
ncbi:MAG: hypothetical protein KGM43_12735 [Planctomycetota bacterium]|nr:hypothetical protein [Planctomycetota bacterium]